MKSKYKYHIKNVLRLQAIVLIFLIILFFTNGCYDHIEVDELVYVVAMGIDRGVTADLRISLMFAIPISIGVGPEPGEIEKSTTMISVEAPTIYDGVNIINSIVGKNINFSHAKLIIISGELAKEGVERFLHTFSKFREFRPHTFLGISRNAAEEFLNITKPILEINPTKYFELLVGSYELTGFTVNSTLEGFYLQMEDTSEEPVAILLDVNKIESPDDYEKLLSPSGTGDGNRQRELNYIAGEIPLLFDNKANALGLAVFKADKMIGEISGQETICFLMIKNRMKQVYYSIPLSEDDFRESEGFVSFRLKPARKTSIKVKMKDNTPVVSVDAHLEADILADTSGKDFSKSDELKKLEDFSAGYIKRNIEDFLEKTSNVFKSDICGVGKSAKKTFFLWDDWIRFNWSEKYKNAEFDVSVKVSVRRTGMTIKQMSPDYYGEGEVK